MIESLHAGFSVRGQAFIRATWRMSDEILNWVRVQRRRCRGAASLCRLDFRRLVLTHVKKQIFSFCTCCWGGGGFPAHSCATTWISSPGKTARFSVCTRADQFTTAWPPDHKYCHHKRWQSNEAQPSWPNLEREAEAVPPAYLCTFLSIRAETRSWSKDVNV